VTSRAIRLDPAVKSSCRHQRFPDPLSSGPKRGVQVRCPVVEVDVLNHGRTGAMRVIAALPWFRSTPLFTPTNHHRPARRWKSGAPEFPGQDSVDGVKLTMKRLYQSSQAAPFGLAFR
jgi:hypothetical protein